MRRFVIVAGSALLLVAAILAVPSTAFPVGGHAAPTPSTMPSPTRPSGLSPYRPPLIQCARWHRYWWDSAPSAPPPSDDPLCVEYDKRNITVNNLGFVQFLYLEPYRFAAAAGKCQYWQKDHWSIQVSRPGQPVLVQWDGSYYVDAVNGEGAGILRNFRVGGHPADANAAANLIERVSPEAAAMIRAYGARGGGGGGFLRIGNPFGC